MLLDAITHGLSAVLGAILIKLADYVFTRKKRKAENTAVVTGAAISLIDKLQEEIERLRERVVSLETANNDKQDQINELHKAIDVINGDYSSKIAQLQGALKLLMKENVALLARNTELDVVLAGLANGKSVGDYSGANSG